MSSRRSRRNHSTQPVYATEDFDLGENDMDTYNPPASVSSNKRSNRSRNGDITAGETNRQMEEKEGAEEGEEFVDEVEEITRCICGEDDLSVPKNHQGEFNNVDPGFFIQCETCSVWQHGYCVGIKDEENSPEKYWCEQCKPHFHTLFTDKFGYRRSQYDASSASSFHAKRGSKRKQGKGQAIKSGDEQTADLDSEIKNEDNDETSDDGKRKHRKRSSIYNYEEMLKKALEESAKESGVNPEDVNITPSQINEGRELRNSNQRKSKTKLSETWNHQADDVDPKLEQGTEGGHKNDNSKNYINTQNHNHKDNDVNVINAEEKPKKDIKKTNRRKTQVGSDMNESENFNETNTETDNNFPDRKLVGGSNTVTPSKRSSRREKKEQKQNVAPEDKPFRANIPSARTNMNEMNRRIFSIVDFVSTIHINLSNEEEFKKTLYAMDDSTQVNPEITELKNKLITCYNDSVMHLDTLTSMLNKWQERYT